MQVVPAFYDHAKFKSPFDAVEWGLRKVEIKDGDKTVMAAEVEAPKHWSDQAVTIFAHKFLRKSGIPQNPRLAALQRVEPVLGPERSIRDAVHRVCFHWKETGLRKGYFRISDSQRQDESRRWEDHVTSNAINFYNNCVYSILMQMWSPNSPQWFNCGLSPAYGIKGSASGLWRMAGLGGSYPVNDSYEYPQIHACFIQSVKDDLVNEGGIMDLFQREARVFKFGSGTGTNFSALRGKGEPLANGGVSGGLLPWLKIGDAAGGAIKSGGTTRKAAKMVCLDVDHPDILEFIRWKAREEIKVKALVHGHQHRRHQHDQSKGMMNPNYMEAAERLNIVLDGSMDGEAYQTVSGQNANNSVRVSDRFMDLVKRAGSGEKVPTWQLRWRTSRPEGKTVSIAQLWDEMAYAAWFCADPGLQFDDTINAWHTCPKGGRINASNPCSEYMFLDDTGCNLASINLMAFWDPKTKTYDWAAYETVIELATTVLDISVSLAGYPSKVIAEKSLEYRTLGLGYCNLGALLMAMGVPYGSCDGRHIAALLTAFLTAEAYETSAFLAVALGPFPMWNANADDMQRVLQKHHDHLTGQDGAVKLQPLSFVNELQKYVKNIHDGYTGTCHTFYRISRPGVQFRNAQVTCIAPTGTIAFIMDADTTGVEPELALVKTKKLAGGGVLKQVNKGLDRLLSRIGGGAHLLEAIKRGEDPQDLPIPSDLKNLLRTSLGKNPLTAEDHLLMMAFVQPFVSGAISKTINMPATATVADVALVHRRAWDLGLKAIAIYRDGCKGSQPVNVVRETDHAVEYTKDEIIEPPGVLPLMAFPEVAFPQTIKAEFKPERRILPRTRQSVTHKFRIENHSGFLTVGMFDDGTPGEVFIRMAKAGSTVHGLYENFGRLASMALQYGVPLEALVKAFQHQRFRPEGLTDDDVIRTASSVLDYVFRWIGNRFASADTVAAGTPPPRSPDTEVGTDTPGSLEDEESGKAGLRNTSGHPAAEATGPPCPECGQIMIRTGTCHTCQNCGYNGGCG